MFPNDPACPPHPHCGAGAGAADLDRLQGRRREVDREGQTEFCLGLGLVTRPNATFFFARSSYKHNVNEHDRTLTNVLFYLYEHFRKT
jgi:hypothetical protein